MAMILSTDVAIYVSSHAHDDGGDGGRGCVVVNGGCRLQELRICALAALLNLTYRNSKAQSVAASYHAVPYVLEFLSDVEYVPT